MIACSKCGHRHAANLIFCPSCGQRTGLGRHLASTALPDYRLQIGVFAMLALLMAALATQTAGAARFLLVVAALAAYALTFIGVRADARARRESRMWALGAIVAGPIGAIAYLASHLGPGKRCRICGQPMYAWKSCVKCAATQQYTKLSPVSAATGAATNAPRKYTTSTRGLAPESLEPQAPAVEPGAESEPRKTNFINKMTATDMRTFLAKAPSLVTIEGANSGKKFRLSLDKTTLGRSQMNNDIVIPDATVSRGHAVITFTKAGTFILRDLDSTNHTFLTRSGARQKVTEIALAEGDVIEIGDTKLQFSDFEARGSGDAGQPDSELSSAN